MNVGNADIIMWGVFALVFLLFASVAFGMGIFSSPNRAMMQRVTRIKLRYMPSSNSTMTATARRLMTSGSGTDVDDFLKRILPRPEELRQRLLRTGRTITLAQYAGACVVLFVALSLILMTFGGLPVLTAALLGIFGGVAIPHLVTGQMINKRLANFTKLFPEAIDLIVRGLKSGLPVTESIQAVGQEMSDPVGIEFRKVANDVRLGQPLEDSLWKAASRLDTPEFKFFVISLSVQRETGGNLAETLGNLSDILRNRQKMKLKIRAMSSEGKASAMIIGALPFIMLGLLAATNYSYVSILFTDSRAQIAGIGGLIWMTIGMFIISKMISFEI